MKLSRSAIALYLGLVFVSGAVLGVMGNRFYTASTTNRAKTNRRPSPEEFRRGYLDTMQMRLGLSEEQVAQLGIILDDTQVQFEKLQRSLQPEQRAIYRNQQDRIRALFDDKQLAEYDVMLREREERQKKNKTRKNKKDGRPGPGF